MKDPDLLKLGLLHEVGVDVAAVMEPQTLLSFQHKSLQDFASSKHLAKRLDKAMKEEKCAKVILVHWENSKELVYRNTAQIGQFNPLLHTFANLGCKHTEHQRQSHH